MDLTSAKGLGNSIHLRMQHTLAKLIQNWKKRFMLVSKETAALLKMGKTTVFYQPSSFDKGQISTMII